MVKGRAPGPRAGPGGLGTPAWSADAHSPVCHPCSVRVDGFRPPPGRPDAQRLPPPGLGEQRALERRPPAGRCLAPLLARRWPCVCLFWSRQVEACLSRPCRHGAAGRGACLPQGCFLGLCKPKRPRSGSSPHRRELPKDWPGAEGVLCLKRGQSCRQLTQTDAEV